MTNGCYSITTTTYIINIASQAPACMAYLVVVTDGKMSKIHKYGVT